MTAHPPAIDLMVTLDELEDVNENQGVPGAPGLLSLQARLIHDWRIMRWLLAERQRLERELVHLLWPYAGDGGETEGATECLARLLHELDAFRAELKR